MGGLPQGGQAAAVAPPAEGPAGGEPPPKRPRAAEPGRCHPTPERIGRSPRRYIKSLKQRIMKSVKHSVGAAAAYFTDFHGYR